jgi:MFS family permease
VTAAHAPPARTNGPFALLLGGLAAFSAYLAMYAFRKPFSAATYADIGGWHFMLDFKSALVIAQVLGYALSKLIGVRVVAELGRRGRAKLILALIATSWVALVLFALVPTPWNVPCLFLNGLPLGMIWGLVFSYLEGRRATELLGAMLCVNFIVSPGLVKSAAVLLLNAGVPELWMPAATGLLFVPILLLSLWQLERMPAPDARDEAERTVRVPMKRADRAAFLREHGLPILLLVVGYILLTALRDFRDNFAAEIWTALGFGGDASIFSRSEIPVAVISLTGLAALMMVKDNMRALLAMHGVIVLGAVLLGLSTLAWQHGLLGPLPWIILTGAGLYLGYIPYNAMLFDRMIAAIGKAGNTGFLIYIADASGYAGSVALLLFRSFAAPQVNWVPFYADSAYVTAIAVGVLALLSAATFVVRYRGRSLVNAAA